MRVRTLREQTTILLRKLSLLAPESPERAGDFELLRRYTRFGGKLRGEADFVLRSVLPYIDVHREAHASRVTLVTDIVCDGAMRMWITGEAPPDHERLAAVVREFGDFVGRAMESPASPVAAAAVFLASLADPFQLRHRVDTVGPDDDPVVAASALLGRCVYASDTSGDLRAQRSSSALLRGAAAVAKLRHGDVPADAPLGDWLLSVSEALPCFPSPPIRLGSLGKSGFAVNLLAELGETHGCHERLFDAALRLGEVDHPPLQREAAKLAFVTGGFVEEERVWKCHVFGELTPSRKAAATKLSASRLAPVSVLGVPAAGSARRRWSGLDTRSGLTLERDGVPLYRRYPKSLDHLTPVERYEAFIDVASGRFAGATGGVTRESAIELIQTIGVQRAADLARAHGDDLAAGFRAAQDQGLVSEPVSFGRSMPRPPPTGSESPWVPPPMTLRASLRSEVRAVREPVSFGRSIPRPPPTGSESPRVPLQ
ncbi:MAG: hypothetical protein AAGE52_10095 [Myxococcota bacterium]